MKGAAIRAESLVRTFRGPDGDRAAVDGVDLMVERGEIYGFLGPNGAGKSTTVRMLVTLLAPTRGDAWINGHSVTSEPDKVRLGVGAALQEAALDLMQTGKETPRLVTDIASGYFDRLLVSPVKRPALLLGLMAADVVLVAALTLPVLIVGFAVGVRFETGHLGVLVFIGMAALWGLALTGLPYTIALRTGSPSAVASSFVIFFPFLFLTTTFLPQDALTGWLATVAEFNPVTYVLAGLRSLITPGWVAADLIAGFVAIGILGAISFTLALLALRARTRRS